MERYKYVEGSKSAHCCFRYTVVDTSQHDDVLARVIVAALSSSLRSE